MGLEVSMKDRFRRDSYSHLIEYDAVIEKAKTLSLLLSSILIVIVLGNWAYNIMNIQYFNPSSATQLIAVSILYSSLILFASIVGFILPHFSTYVRPRVFKESKDERTRLLLQGSMIIILFTTIIISLFIAYNFYMQVF
ncbi:MAG: hypothetical protein QXY95_00535 [Thermosphaera sp.]